MREQNNNIQRTTIYERVAAPVIIGVFFCFLCFYFGIGEYPDSVTYIEGSMDREPVYPILLKMFGKIFGNGYLWAVIIAQNLFAFLVTWYLHGYVCKRFRLNHLFFWGSLAVLLFPHMMSGVFTPSGIILTNSILSEGITLTLYQLFFVLILKMWMENSVVRYGILALLVAFFAALARGQMMPMLLVWLVIAFFAICRRKMAVWKKCAGVLLILILTVAAFIGRGALIESYNEASFGVKNGNTGGNMTLLTNVIYSASEEDVRDAADKMTDEDGALLLEIYAQIQARELTSADAGEGVLAHIYHHEDSHDRIKFEVLYENMEGYVREGIAEPTPELIKVAMDEQAGMYMRALLPECAGDFLMTYLYVICGGFIRTVAVLHPVLNLYALLIYIVAIGLMWYLFMRGRKQDASGMMAMVLVMIAANVCATGLTIMCLSRYMIYNMAIFYVAGIVLLQALLDLRRHRKK